MKMYLVSDNRDTLVGMRLAGVKGCIVENKKEAANTIDSLLKDKEIGIIILTEKIADLIRDKVNFLKQKVPYPLVVEIPDRHGSVKDSDYMAGYIRDSIGIKV